MVKILRSFIVAYFVIGIAMAGLGFIGLKTGEPPKGGACPYSDLAPTPEAGAAPAAAPGSNQTYENLAMRVVAWPYSVGKAMSQKVSITDWLMMKYDYTADACKWGRA